MSESEIEKSDQAVSRERLKTSASQSQNEISCDIQETPLQNETFCHETNVESQSNGSSSEHINSVTDDESSNSDFIIIKPTADAIEKDLENKESEEENVTSKVIVIQNSSELSLEGLDATVLSQVQRVLEENGLEHSVMIINEADNVNIQNEASYIIDLKADDKSHVSSTDATLTVSNIFPSATTTTSALTSSTSTSKLVTYSLNKECASNEISSQTQANTSPLSSVSSNNTDSFVESSRTVMDKSPYSVASSIINSNSNELNETIAPSSNVSVDNSVSKCHSPKNLTIQTTSSHNQTNPPQPSDEKHIATSHVAEQLLNIAKKMIGESGSVSQRISMDDSLSKIVISPEQKPSGEKNSESVITMYLSSPNELKSKLEKFKTDSPVIIVQAGEEPLTEEEEDDDKKNIVSLNENQTPLSKVETTIKIESYSSGSDSKSQLNVNESCTSQSDNQAAVDSVVYSCSECGYSSQNKHYYKQHVDLVHNEYRPYKCPHCDYAGKRRHALFEHMVVHSDIRPYVCGHCKANFRKKSHLTSHIKLHTSHHRLVQCGVCNIQLPDVEAFESHLRKIHNTDKLYKCKLCNHTVVDRHSMLNHLSSHSESIIFSCPNCSSYFNEEKSLTDHMKEAHKVNKVNEEALSSSSDKSSPFIPEKSSVPADDGKTAQQTKIVCTECGFMCNDSQVMKKHMWVHINSSSEMNVQIKGQTSSGKVGAASNNAMGLLKMNVVSGLKTLPENVVYQCTSCNFNSSDNSAFIKHMLLHKTQRKTHPPAAAKPEIHSEETKSSASSEKTKVKPISILPKPSQSDVNNTSTEKQSSNIPFVFDQSSGRYRCLICGYHCDYQRTVKAHIWKHSGHQNIEYPVFDDQTKKVEATSSATATVGNAEPKSKLHTASSASLSSITSRPLPLPMHQMPVLKSSSQDVKLVPIDPSSGTYKVGDIIFVNSNSLPVSDKNKKDPPASQLLNTEIALTPVKSENVISEESLKVSEYFKTVLGEIQKLEEKKKVSSSKISTNSICENESHVTKSDPIIKNSMQDDGCTEPSVVVEIVDTVPSGLGLTGLKSQQGSPRVSDLESSGGDLKLSSALKDALSSEKSPTEDTASLAQQHGQVTAKRKYNLRKPKDTNKYDDPSSSEQENNKITENSVKEGYDTGPTDAEKTVTDLIKMKSLKKSEANEEVENLINAESDTTESSDEVYSAGESGSSSSYPPKTGICSSLLAVIEQLRERSRSEGEKILSPTKDLPKRISKRNKKYGIHADVTPLSEFQNIEKINAGDGEKYRCSLCHYTSQRICNLKIHMKTHRQKKPSECSLCDFSSTTPEALQEHMLQHCKVRTYACKFCPQSFNHKSTLRAHMRAHKDKEPNFCPYCVFETTNLSEFKEHMQVHSGCSSRLRCPSCDHIMNSKEELTAHLIKCTAGNTDSATASTVGDTKQTDLKQAQESTGSSMAESDNPITSTSSTVVATEHACVVSGCSFTSYSLKELQEHLSVHCNPSLLVCELCDFKALHSRSLKSHMKRHANDQRYVQQPLEQYKCNLCGYVCHHLPSLKSHMWRHASDESYSYEFTNDVINAAIDHDSRVDANAGEADDPELLDRVINSERRIMEGELTKTNHGDGQRPVCWVTFRCCSCGFETINKAKLNVHMRTHPDIIKQTLEGFPSKPGQDKSSNAAGALTKSPTKRMPIAMENEEPCVPPKVKKAI